MRRLLLEALQTVEAGGSPRGLDPETCRAVRPHDRVVPPGEDWRTLFEQELRAKW
jgi:hypothetical protein